MKKLITFLMILALGAGINLQASQPIPSYNAHCYKDANFQEKHHDYDGKDQKKKRNMIIIVQVAGPSGDPAPIYITPYSLDMRTVLGPYVIYSGAGTITVPIDDRDWGVIVQCDDKVYVTVTIDDGGGSGIGGGGNL